MRFRRPYLAVAAITMASLFGITPALAACQPGPMPISLPAQRMDERLQALAHATGCHVDVDDALIAGKRVLPLRGTLPTDQMFFRTVQGSGLEVEPNQGHWRVSRDQQRYFAQRIARIGSDIAAARRNRRITAAQAAGYQRELATVRSGVPHYVREQGFLSAAERSSYTAMLDRIAGRLRR